MVEQNKFGNEVHYLIVFLISSSVLDKIDQEKEH
jgi:hypothetical protein